MIVKIVNMIFSRQSQLNVLLWVIMLISGTLFSCEPEEVLVDLPLPGDYYPLLPGNQWQYIRTHTYRCNCQDSGLVLIDTLRLYIDESYRVDDGAIINDRNQHLIRHIRKNGNLYIDIPAYRDEYIFLIDNKPVDYSWRQGEHENAEIEFTVEQVNGTMNVSGISYKNVIEIREVVWATAADSDVEKIFSVTHRFYAKGIGEIYAMEAVYWDGDSSTRELTLIKHFKS